MNLFKDARDYQILCLSLFLMMGIINRDWTLKLNFLGIIIVACLGTQFLFSSINQSGREVNPKLNSDNKVNDGQQFFFLSDRWLAISSLRSALISSLSLCLLLRANHPLTLAMAAFFAIASKFLFEYNDKHFFNPANFGIIAAITLSNDAWLSPGQWGNDWSYFFLFACTGAMVLKKVGRWETTAIFLLTYSGLHGTYNYFLGWNFDVLEHQLMGGSLLIFSFFMLTDPRSIPNAKVSRIIWSCLIAILAFILERFFYVNNAIFWALFALSPLSIYLDSIWLSPRFQWKTNNLKLN